MGLVSWLTVSGLVRSQDSPTYRPGLYTCIAVCLLSLILVGALSITFYFENTKADRGEKELESSDVRATVTP